ncbi:hypothetical protein K1719_005318 [Acacia pycnantha]|nr:hypothetical protein K1719_005318 [Acacia pycnantha]
MRALGESLCWDIICGSPDVKWESIKGLENAKRLLKEAVVLPIKYPKWRSEVGEEEKDGYGWLEEIEMPENSQIDGIEYRGPPVNDIIVL